MQHNRIKGDFLEISDDAVKEFFDNRKQKSLPHRYNYVNYQDNNPKLALERDRIEKEKVLKFFPVSGEDRVLDIGCGVGRWGDYVVPLLKSGRYVGVDYTEYFIELAEKQFSGNERAHFIKGSFQQLRQVLEEAGENERFSRILVNGVLMYMNDDDILSSLKSCDDLLEDHGLLYVKESAGISERLTLNKFYSEDLGVSYSVIYRSLKEYTDYLVKAFLCGGYVLVACMPTWEDRIDYGAETSNYMWILKKEQYSRGRDIP